MSKREQGVLSVLLLALTVPGTVWYVVMAAKNASMLELIRLPSVYILAVGALIGAVCLIDSLASKRSRRYLAASLVLYFAGLIGLACWEAAHRVL